jgi:hypothetical protein
MNLAFDRIGARHRGTFHSPASFHAKRLSLVEHWKKNALNKYIRAPQRVLRRFGKGWLTMFAGFARRAREAG